MNLVMVHGSVETSCEQRYMDALAMAALKGYEVIETGLINAVEHAVMTMEDDPLFNAGYGSVLNMNGDVEMDAAIMDGSSGSCGAVAAIQDVRNPVSIARKIAEETPHVLLAGQGAMEFARSAGFPSFNPVTDLQRFSWQKAKELLSRGEQLSFSAFTGLPRVCDTVGCVAFKDGHVAAASSTGGSFLKLPGRVGDTPVIGGGIYASSYGAAVCTGLGEAFVKLNLAGWALNLLAQGVQVVDAAKAAIRRLAHKNVSGGILIVNSNGDAVAAHNSSSFPVALVVDGKYIRSYKPELVLVA